MSGLHNKPSPLDRLKHVRELTLYEQRKLIPIALQVLMCADELNLVIPERFRFWEQILVSTASNDAHQVTQDYLRYSLEAVNLMMANIDARPVETRESRKHDRIIKNALSQLPQWLTEIQDPDLVEPLPLRANRFWKKIYHMPGFR